MRSTLTFAALTFALCVSARAGVITFQDQTVAVGSYDNGASHGTGFTGFVSGEAFFNNTYNSNGGYWNGWSMSRVDNTGADYNPAGGVDDYSGNHQYASASGGGVGGQTDAYAVGYYDGFDPTYINLPTGESPLSVQLNNTTYDVLSMEHGDGFAKQFGPNDYFTAILTGYAGEDATGLSTGSVEFNLATGTNIVTDWTNVDLSSLGATTESVGLTFASSDSGDFGVNTPTYVALDDLTVTPEPAAGAMLVLLGAAIMLRGRYFGRRISHVSSGAGN